MSPGGALLLTALALIGLAALAAWLLNVPLWAVAGLAAAALALTAAIGCRVLASRRDRQKAER